jgi:hypothetical protein
VALFPAHEVEFMATAGKRYQIESTADGESWAPASEVIIGNDQFTSLSFILCKKCSLMCL